MKRKGLTIAVLIVVVLIYQAPNVALLAHSGGLSLAEPRMLGIDVQLKDGWYPIATNGSLIGRMSIPDDAPPMIAFHRPTVLWPWKADVFAIIALKSVDPKSVESTQTFPWGTAALLKPASNDPRRLYAVSGLGVGILVSNPDPLQDIVALKKAN